jgi:hypothetical protein
MKTIFKILALFTSILFIQSCQKVIDVDLVTAPSKLVVEANIAWQKGTSGNRQTIKLSTTTGYFSQTFPVVSGAIVQVVNSNNMVFSFLEQVPNSGLYVCINFLPVLNESYTLSIIAGGQTYRATEKLIPITPITKLEQKNNGGFLGNEIEVKAFFIDPGNAQNFYLYNYKYNNQIKPDFYIDRDLFYQGNEFFSRSRNNDLKAGNVINITHFGISENYHNYLAILLDIAGSSGGGPFQSPPATVKGNVVNQTNFDNFPLGFFSVSETDSRSYTIQ